MQRTQRFVSIFRLLLELGVQGPGGFLVSGLVGERVSYRQEEGNLIAFSLLILLSVLSFQFVALCYSFTNFLNLSKLINFSDLSKIQLA